jgi:DNA processing protein
MTIMCLEGMWTMAADSVAFDVFTLLTAPGVGPSRMRKLLRRWLDLGNSELLDIAALREAVTSEMATVPVDREGAARRWAELAEQDVRVVSVFDPTYPAAVQQILGADSPMLLFCRGEMRLLQSIGVGFCGSRRATAKGIETASESAKLLVQGDINIVSGFAAGVDMSAHRAALAAGGTTTIVLAEGILRFRIKREIRELWDSRRTLVVSEFAPNGTWRVDQAMRRNRTICGLSRAMILIEARASGGSIQAGRDCLRLGLPLFAAVYEDMPEWATGNKQLLEVGARRLMKNRSTNLPNVRPVLESIRSVGVSAKHTQGHRGAASGSRQIPLLD